MAAGVRIASGGREELTFRVALQIWRAWLSLLFGTSASLVDRNLFGPSSISFRPKSLSLFADLAGWPKLHARSRRSGSPDEQRKIEGSE
jgi:hypothetical protein